MVKEANACFKRSTPTNAAFSKRGVDHLADVRLWSKTIKVRAAHSFLPSFLHGRDPKITCTVFSVIQSYYTLHF
ncbi:MAG: hypothetical protein O7D30_07240, partial [Rickettsia endosymbiont of Ixodes persulcatus]|nr:hypothetical protein [Rickettsia endosymbiont of Ixodes persulcatus]